MKHTDARFVITHSDKNTGEENRDAVARQLLNLGWRPMMGMGLWENKDGCACTLECAAIKENLGTPMKIQIFS